MRHHLRSATTAEHERVDALFSALRLDLPSGYATFLSAQAPAILALEEALTEYGVDAVVADWPQRRRSRALLDDLADLGAGYGTAEAPAIASDDEALAALYVLEGSRLGGRVLLGRVLASPQVELHRATRFLRHGQQERLWQSFLSVLDGRNYNAQSALDMVRTARATFAVFERSARDAVQQAAPSGSVDAKLRAGEIEVVE